MMSLNYVLCLVLFAFDVHTIKQESPCPDIKPVNDFKFDTKWYVVSAASDAKFFGVCATLSFVTSPGSNIYNITNRWMEKKTAYYYIGTGNLINNNSTLNISYPDSSYNASVIDTDYKHYALLYTCSDKPVDNTSDYQIWVLSHTRSLNQTYMDHINTTLASINLDNKDFKNFNNSRESCANEATVFSIGIITFILSFCVVTKEFMF